MHGQGEFSKLINSPERSALDYLMHLFPYLIAIGAAMALAPTIIPVFEQLGMLEELQSFSYNIKQFVFRNEKLKTVGSLEMADQEKMYGSFSLVCACSG